MNALRISSRHLIDFCVLDEDYFKFLPAEECLAAEPD
jgi:hypothetical protein